LCHGTILISENQSERAQTKAFSAQTGGFMEIRKLNMIRAIAALIIMVSHYSNKTHLLDKALANGAGQLGVMLFFVLSGFLMSYVYMNREFTRLNVKRFWVARVARIMPLYVLVILVSYLLYILGIEEIFYSIESFVDLFSQLLMLSGKSVLWAVSVQVHFYVFFMLLWWLHSRKAGFPYILMSVIFICLVFLDFPNPEWKLLDIDVETRIIRSLPYFFVGVVYGQIYRYWKAPDYLRRNGFVLALLILLLLYPKIFNSLTGHSHQKWSDVGVFLVIAAVFFSQIFLVPNNSAFLSNPFGDFLGKISYSLFLLHVPTLALTQVPAREYPAAFLPAFVALSVVAASISYFVVENPARKAIRSIMPNNSPQSTSPDVAAVEHRH
jgi:peptidoglycan/LPS O-acetylase OafA/YrhL